MSYYTMHSRKGQGLRRSYQSEDGRVIVSITAIRHDQDNRHDLANIWLRKGLINRFMPSTLHVDVYHYAENGHCYGRYNPTMLSVPGRYTINFARLLEDTPENELALVAEVAAMYRDGVKCYKADGWTPCEAGADCIAR